MQLVASFEALAAGPVGRALAGSSFVAWCATPRLSGTVHFGTREELDAATLTRLYGLVRSPALKPPLRRVVDGRALAGISEGAWAQMMAMLAPQVEQLRGLFERQAVIVADGVAGARTAALLPALGPDDTFRVFTDPDAAYRFADPVDGASAQSQVDALVRLAISSRHLEAKVRAWLARNLRGAEVQRCARALGLSERTLQRQLAAHGTTYRELVVAERVALAQARLVGGDDKVEAIARMVGCSSASQLGVLLRRAGLGTASAIRDREAVSRFARAMDERNRAGREG